MIIALEWEMDMDNLHMMDRKMINFLVRSLSFLSVN